MVKKQNIKYSIYFKKNPIEIEIIVLKENKEKGKILGAIKRIKKDSLLLTLSFTGKRDYNFDISNKDILNSVLYIWN